MRRGGVLHGARLLREGARAARPRRERATRIAPTYGLAWNDLGQLRLHAVLEAARRTAAQLRAGRYEGPPRMVPLGEDPVGSPAEAASWRTHAADLAQNGLVDEARLFERIATQLGG